MRGSSLIIAGASSVIGLSATAAVLNFATKNWVAVIANVTVCIVSAGWIFAQLTIRRLDGAL